VKHRWPSFRRRFKSRELGPAGERRARWHYRLRGYSIIARNVRFDGGEIDFVARRGGSVALVEVKTRQSERAGTPSASVTERKRQRLVGLAERYLLTLRDRDSVRLRFDVVSVVWTGLRFRVDVIRDAFRPTAEAGRPWRWS
jgi:putative endonuclease